jgi:CheY-like chemotaxis protein
MPNLPIAEKRPRLLVVDDQPINIQTLFEIFDADCDVFMATSGKQALTFAVSEPPDLILLDVVMPEMDGHEVCRQLKANEQTRDIPVIAVSASAMTQDIERGRRIGVSGALTLAALAVERWREERGLVSAVEVRPHVNVAGAVVAARRGDVDFVGAPDTALRDALPPGSPDFRRVLTLGRQAAPAFVASSPAVSAADVAAFGAALLAFGGAGTSFASAQYVAGTATDLTPWRSYAARARQMLATVAEPRQR